MSGLGVWVGLCAGLWASPLFAPVARACSPVGCIAPAVFPASGAALPEGQQRLRFQPGRDFITQDAGVARPPKLYRVDGAKRTELTVAITSLTNGAQMITPITPSSVGSKLVLEADPVGCSPQQPLHAEFTVTAAATVPANLGTLSVALGQAALLVPTSRGSCTISLEAAYADLTLLRANEAQAFADVTEPQLWVDGSAYGSAMRVYATCQPFQDSWAAANLKLGKHRAELRGTLLDGSVLKTPEVEFELRCEGVAGLGDAGLRDAGTTADAGSAGAGWVDAAVARALDPGADASTVQWSSCDASGYSESLPRPATNEGCALTTGRPLDRSTLAAFVAGVGVLLARRRKARRLA